MKPRSIILALVLAATAACGSSQDDKIVMEDPSTGTTRTYGEVRDMITNGDIKIPGGNCSSLVAFGDETTPVRFPEGQGAFVAACEEGLKAKKD